MHNGTRSCELRSSALKPHRTDQRKRHAKTRPREQVKIMSLSEIIDADLHCLSKYGSPANAVTLACVGMSGSTMSRRTTQKKNVDDRSEDSDMKRKRNQILRM